MKFDEYSSCDSKIGVCEIQSIGQVMQDHFSCEDEEKQEVEEELIENEVSFFYPFQRLEVSRKYIQQFSVKDDILVTCSKLKNKLYTLKLQEKHKQNNNIGLVKK
jgi:hypothetical protein